MIQAARQAFLATEDELRRGKSALERVYHASRLLMESERDDALSPADKLKALEKHFERMRNLARGHEDAGNAENADGAEARAYLAEAELLVAQAKAPKPAPAAQPGQPGKSDGPGKDPKSLAILARLEEPLAMSFPNETPLEDVLKYIKVATQGTSDSGIPIYVDPLGLQEADKTLTSPVQLDLEGVPLRRTLQLALQQLGLVYFVDDGLLVITSAEAEDKQLRPTSIEPPPFVKKQQKAERGEMNIKEMKEFVDELKVRTEVMKQLRALDDLGGMGGGMYGGHAVKTDQVAALLKEMKALVDQIKAEREKARKDGSK
jgi:hypothetical protein